MNELARWHDLNMAPAELRCDVTLRNGQCFHWSVSKLNQDNEPCRWRAVLARSVAVELWQRPEATWFRVLGCSDADWRIALQSVTKQSEIETGSESESEKSNESETETESESKSEIESESELPRIEEVRKILALHLHADVALTELGQDVWKSTDVAPLLNPGAFQGLRLLRQEPWECLISFLVSANNNIKRIESLLTKLRETYGTRVEVFDCLKKQSENSSEEAVKLGEIEPLVKAGQMFKFPTLAQLSAESEETFRTMGLGYRAPRLVQTIKTVAAKGGIKWLESLRDLPASAESRKHVRQELLALAGVGPKVADCVALFSLDRLDLSPVDTHVWQITQRRYMPLLRQRLRQTQGKKTTKLPKSVTPAVHDAVGDVFRSLYGQHAGWAQQLLFAAELPQFKQRLVHTKRPSESVGDSSASDTGTKPTSQSASASDSHSRDDSELNDENADANEPARKRRRLRPRRVVNYR
ncbi:MAG: hypothetical protein MHM6MM_003023 [Cercozoa sp. M6MM]